jgi:hypothetical protein
MAYLDVKEPSNPICQSNEGLLEALYRGTIYNGDISLIEVLIFTGFYWIYWITGIYWIIVFHKL